MIDSIDGAPNKWLQRWLQHPSYDKYWQYMLPYKNEFAKINIPVLTITGYYDDGQQSALHYLKEHYRYNKNADHFLLIGPYDHFGAQASRKPPVLNGYAIDPVAQIDTPEIPFQWLDYVMRDGKKPDLSNGFSFISEPFDELVEINGTFLGEIKASINKKDMDIGVVLYEVMPNGELFHLSYFLGRASYSRDMSIRNLLAPGKVESIPFDKTRMVSHRLSKGSRLLVTLNVNKNPYAQINYGTGKDVSDEDIDDAKIPLQIKWQNDSFVKIPIWNRIRANF
jgi:predicted acyl esterase